MPYILHESFLLRPQPVLPDLNLDRHEPAVHNSQDIRDALFRRGPAHATRRVVDADRIDPEGVSSPIINKLDDLFREIVRFTQTNIFVSV